MTFTHRERFPFEVGTSPEPLPEPQHDTYTATLWTVHLRVTPGGSLEQITDRLLAQQARLHLTGHLIGGDSFGAWAEPWVGDDDRALHVYFRASNPTDAFRLARAIAGEGGCKSPYDWAVSTAADWAMQIHDDPAHVAAVTQTQRTTPLVSDSEAMDMLLREWHEAEQSGAGWPGSDCVDYVQRLLTITGRLER